MTTIGQNIRLIRKSKSITVMELAKIANISRRTLQYAERGVKMPHYGTVQKIAQALDVSIGALTDDKDEQ